MSSSLVSATALFGVLLINAATCSATPLYSLQSLGALGSGASFVSGMNASGVAAGGYTNHTGDIVPATFSSGGRTTLSGVGIASGINSNGVVIGTTYSGNTPMATEWSNGQTKSMGVPGYGNAINDAGQFAGGYITGNGSLHAYIGSGTTIHDLGVLGGSWSSVAALNAAGQAAGTSSTNTSGFRAFFWDGSAMQNLGTLGGANSYGNGLNGKGQVVGSSQMSTGYLNAFLWSSSGMLDLGTLGGTTSAAYGVNDSGDVVGYSLMGGNGVSHGFLETGGVMLDLNGLLPVGSGWTITAAYGIDQLGDILGTATYKGANYAVELFRDDSSVPNSASSMATPEPALLSFAGLGFLGVAFAGRRRKPTHAQNNCESR